MRPWARLQSPWSSPATLGCAPRRPCPTWSVPVPMRLFPRRTASHTLPVLPRPDSCIVLDGGDNVARGRERACRRAAVLAVHADQPACQGGHAHRHRTLGRPGGRWQRRGRMAAVRAAARPVDRAAARRRRAAVHPIPVRRPGAIAADPGRVHRRPCCRPRLVPRRHYRRRRCRGLSWSRHGCATERPGSDVTAAVAFAVPVARTEATAGTDAAAAGRRHRACPVSGHRCWRLAWPRRGPRGARRARRPRGAHRRGHRPIH